MKSRITDRFRQAFGYLPEQIQEQTRQAYRQFQENPSHPSLRFKKMYIQVYPFTRLESAKPTER